MILKFDLKELQTRIGCNLIEDNFIERVLIENYTYKRRDGVDYTSLLKDIFLSMYSLNFSALAIGTLI